MDLISAADTAREHANTRKTFLQQDLSWKRWTLFLRSIELENDIFLNNFTDRERTIITSAFAEAVRKREFSRKSVNPLVSSTVRTAVDNISQTFREYDHGDPRLDSTGKLARILQQQFKGYKENDPDERQEKAIPFSVIRQMNLKAISDLDKAIADLCTGAIFFCMRSCEYSKVQSQEDRKTKLLCARNLRFFKGNNLIPQSSKSISEAEVISITFEDQKNREKHETVNLHRSNDNTLCPVRAWTKVIKRLHSYKNFTTNMPINTFVLNNSTKYITNSNISSTLKSTVDSMPEFNLGFKSSEVGTHSIRSGGAMALCLAKVEVFMIMIIGRWKSNSFMKYI